MEIAAILRLVNGIAVVLLNKKKKQYACFLRNLKENILLREAIIEISFFVSNTYIDVLILCFVFSSNTLIIIISKLSKNLRL